MRTLTRKELPHNANNPASVDINPLETDDLQGLQILHNSERHRSVADESPEEQVATT